jgi:UDP-glucuronate decarboxylase
MTYRNQIESDIKDIITKEFQDFFRDKNVLITGASGLMGSYFTTLFQVFNRDFAGNVSLYLVSKSNDYPISIDNNSIRLVLDLTHNLNLRKLPKFDFVIHGAGHAQPSLFQKSPISTVSINSTATVSFLQKMAPNGTFLFLSSSEVYSGLTTMPYMEKDVGQIGPEHPRSAYIESKRLGEAIVCNSQIEYPEIKTFAARLSLAYGPGVRISDSRVLNQFVFKALKFGTIELMDSGSALRTYCYVSDAIEMCINIVMKGKERIYNVGGESKVTILELAEKIAAKTGATIRLPVNSNSSQLGAPVDVSLDLERIKSLAEKKHFVSLSTGLDHTLNWFIEKME